MPSFSAAVGPLDPNPFAQTPSVFELGWPLLFWPRHSPSLPWSGVDRFRTSATAVAFIPPRALPHRYAVAFHHDGVTQQPDWLSRACADDRFRTLHGIQLDWASLSAPSEIVPLDLRVLNRSNPTRVRFLPGIRFDARIEATHHPGWLLPPPPRSSRPYELVGIGNSMRSMNGFLATPVGRLAGAIRASALKILRLDGPTDLPMIGSTLNLWIASDGCRALVAIHNTFPQYTYYLDGWQVTWEDAPARSFRDFDGYGIEVDWRRVLALAMYDAMRNYPAHSRYPGGCTFGWWSGIASDGDLVWCDKGTPLTSIDFGPPPRSPEEWWSGLEEYTRISRERAGERGEQQSSEADLLDQMWRRLGAERWRCRRFRRQAG